VRWRLQVLATFALFVIAVTLWIYLDFDTSDGYIGDPASLALIPVYVALGAVVNSGWAFLTLLVPILIAIPAGHTPDRDTPVYAFMIFPLAPVGAALIAIGIALRRLLAPRLTRA
jgi:hypothetical protein